VETLVVMLTALLRRWVEGDEQGFKVPARGQSLASASLQRGVAASLRSVLARQPSGRC
jgi:hypothetical protein